MASGRWHHKGRPVVYMAGTPAGAMLETLVHLEIDEAELPEAYQLLKISFENDVSLIEIDESMLPEGWRNDPELTQALGDSWLAEGESLLLAVPSAIMTDTQNFLFNPAHPEAEEAVVEAGFYEFDQRLFKLR